MPPKTQNYNYAFLFYDVNERRVQWIYVNTLGTKS